MVKAIGASELEDGGIKVVRVEGRSLALSRVGEEFFAMDNTCLHRGGPLGEGGMDGFDIICHWHGWSYDVRTGAFKVIPALKVRTYVTRREGDSVMVDLDGAE